MADVAGGAVRFERALALLAEGELTVEGRLPWSSNATWLATVRDGDLVASAVYKPRRGERPLWDFPPGTLYRREVAAFLVSQALGWGLVPPTVIRDGPWGPGALQVFVPHDPEAHFLTLESPDPRVVDRLVAFDVVTNNADRKSGHVLAGDDGALWAIDHGVTFHVEPKLRTVIWERAGRPVPESERGDLEALAAALEDPASALRAALAPLLSAAEVRAVARRARDLLAAGRFPAPAPEGISLPWPPV